MSFPRTNTSATNPHMQLDQQPMHPMSGELVERISLLDGVVLGSSGRAPAGTIGIHLHPDCARGPADAFMLSTEFAHVHPAPDHSLHLVLPEPLRGEAVATGWAEPHPLAGYPTVSALIVLLYAPRNPEELGIACDLVTASWAYASGRWHETTARG